MFGECREPSVYILYLTTQQCLYLLMCYHTYLRVVLLTVSSESTSYERLILSLPMKLDLYVLHCSCNTLDLRSIGRGFNSHLDKAT